MANILLVAWDKNRLIGSKNTLPWKIKADLKLFKERTMNHTLVMGRSTWESLGCKPLPGRQHVVLSRNWQESPSKIDYVQVHYLSNLREALTYAGKLYCDQRDVFIIGGAQIYKSALDKGLADSMIVTQVNGEHEGDTYFPDFDESQWDRKIQMSCPEFDVVEYTKHENQSGNVRNEDWGGQQSC